MADLDWSSKARKDVDGIYDYIGEHEGRPATADKFVKDLVAKCESYADAFAAGHVMGTARPDLGEGHRVLPHKRWVIIIRPIDDGMEVLRVVDGSRDYSKLFGG